jgi:hypothetical protein
MQCDCNHVRAEHGLVLAAAPLFLVDVFLPLYACRVHSAANESGLTLKHAIAELSTVHPRVWLHVLLLIPRRVFEPFFVCIARSLMPVVLDAALLFLVDVLLPLSACCVHSVANEAGLTLWNASAVLATVHPLVWLHVAQLIPRHVLESFFVCLACSLLPGFPRFELQLLVALLPLRAYDDLRLAFCEALCSIALQTDYVNRRCSIQHEMHNNVT